MPPLIAAAIAYIVPAAAGAGLYVGATMTFVSYATMIGYAVTIGAAVAYSSAQNAKMRSLLNNITDTGRTVMARDPLAMQRGIYGQIPTAGPIFLMHTTGAKNDKLHVVMGVAGHECAELGKVYFQDSDGMTEVPLDGAGNATGKYAGFFLAKMHLGTNVQTADATLLAAAPALWTANHRLRGTAYAYLQFTYNVDLFPNGMPTVLIMTKGKLLMDPRVGIYLKSCDMVAGNPLIGCADCSSLTVGMRVQGSGIVEGTRIISIDGSGTFFTTDTAPQLTNATARLACGVVAWSANSELCAADYVSDFKLGRGVPWHRINRDLVAAEANICDEDVVLDDASTEKRYATNGSFTSDQDALPDLLSAMAGSIVDTGGLYEIFAGAYRTPTTGADFTDGDLVGVITTQPRQSMRESYSGVRGTYIAPINQWQPADFVPQKNALYAAKDGHRRRWKNVTYGFTTSSPTAQRLAKADLENGRQQLVVQAVYKLKAFKVACMDTVRVTSVAEGWTNKTFRVLSWSLRIMNKDGAMSIAVAVTLKETAAAIWDWANGEETVVDLAPNSDLPSAAEKPTAPSFISLTTNASTVIVEANGTVTPRILVQWPLASNVYVESGGKIEMEYKATSSADWIPWGPARGDAVLDYIIGVKVGTQYNVRIRYVTEIGVHSDWTSGTSGAVVGDTLTPNTPSSLTALPVPGSIRLSWPPSTTNTVNEYAIYRSVTSAIAGFTLLANAFLNQFDDGSVTPGTTYWYQVQAVTESEVASSPVTSTGVIALNPAIGAALPSNPTAPNFNSSGTYDVGDGGVMSYVILNVFALPANAQTQDIRFRVNGGTSDWQTAAQPANVSTITVRCDDLSPGVAYDFAIRAHSPAGYSATIAGPTITAPGKAVASANPTGFVAHSPSSTWPVPAKYYSGGQLFGCTVEFSASTARDISAIEFASAASSVVPPPSADGAFHNEDRTFFFYSTVLSAQFLWVRAINTSGIAAAWVYTGLNINLSLGLPAGTLSIQNSNDATVTAFKTGGSSAVQIRSRHAFSQVFTLAGGVDHEDFQVTLPSGVFATKPDAGSANVAGTDNFDTDYDAFYNFDNGSNSTTQAWVKIFRPSGANTTAGRLVRVQGEFVEYF